MTKLHVLLMQLPVPNNPATNVPLAAGYLKAYAHAQGLLDRIQIDILPRALADSAGDALLVDEVVARAPAVLGISLYTWNSERSLDIAGRVKEQLPGLIVVVGGPEVQRDDDWIVRHPAVDVAVFGEGEQTFAELLLLFSEHRSPISHLQSLALVRGVAFHDVAGNVLVTPERPPLDDLAAIPSPYLLGYLEVAPDSMLMVEVSRWCPYACSFCLYGRNMGPKLGSRYFGLERVLAEIDWGRGHGATRVHFIEANLNLVPIFRPLMGALADMNADGQLALYAELRGEHLTDEAVEALARAGLRVAEVGLQTGNPIALKAAHRKTDLRKWAAGTRRLIKRGIEVYLDVILGLPADDPAGVVETLDFIRREELGLYDIFTLQVLPGTGVREQASAYALTYQDRPPYYVTSTDRFDYDELRRLRRELKIGAGLAPDEVEGCPQPRPDALCPRTPSHTSVEQLYLLNAGNGDWEAALDSIGRLANHVEIIAGWDDRVALSALLERSISANPSTLFDCYLLTAAPPSPPDLRVWREALPYQPGYLDRVAIFRRDAPEPPHDRVSPRLWLVLPWSAQVEPRDYGSVAGIIWMYRFAAGEEPPFSAWSAAGGVGIWVHGASRPAIDGWRQRADQELWYGDEA
jgi:radical SAM superfamily enzyme YgiQ (UPF0313 family)